jgi:3-methyl-2-oxobutanoate hydroxymethyltransferase
MYLPKFVRKYANTHAMWLNALRDYIHDVQSGAFPNDQESYHLHKDIDEFLQ